MFDNDIRIAKSQSLTDFTPTASEYLGAAFTQGFKFTPISSVFRMEELRRAKVGTQIGFPLSASQAQMFDPSKLLNEQPRSNMVDQQTALNKVKENQLKLEIPAEGIRQEALDILIERKKDEIKNNYQINAAPDGILPAIGKFSADIAANLLDPINIAASFIPVVSQAKWAAATAKASSALGRAGVRAGLGFTEAAVGNALLEPVIYAAARQEQADYDMMDSVYNVLIGGLIGSGLHAGAGAIGDAIKAGRTGAAAETTGGTAKALQKADHKTREAMFRAAMQAEARGQRLDVNAVGAFDPALNPTTRAAVTESVEPGVVAPDVEPAVTLDVPAQTDLNAGLANANKQINSVENSRTADVESLAEAERTVQAGDPELDASIQAITEDINDIAARNNVDVGDLVSQYEAPVRDAEIEAKALEAAVLCRMG